MNGFALLCRVQVLALVNSLAPERQGSKRRSRTTRLALAGVVAIALGALMAAYVALMGMGLVAMGLTEVIPAFALVVGSLAGIVFAFMKARGTLFGLADWDHVMSLPISRRAVVASRLGTVFLAAIVLSAVFMTPLFVVYFLHAPANPVSVIFAVLSIPLAPLAPVSASVFAAFGVTMLTVRFRHANLAYIVLALAFFTLIFVGAYALSFSAGTASDPAAKLAAFGSVASARRPPGHARASFRAVRCRSLSLLRSRLALHLHAWKSCSASTFLSTVCWRAKEALGIAIPRSVCASAAAGHRRSAP